MQALEKRVLKTLDIISAKKKLMLGTHFSRFTGTKVQILTQKALLVTEHELLRRRRIARTQHRHTTPNWKDKVTSICVCMCVCVCVCVCVCACVCV